MKEGVSKKQVSLIQKSLDYLKKNKLWIIGLIAVTILSFILFMISLTQYPLSYSPDGPYYDIQVRAIIRTGLPETDNPPLVFYYLTIFVVLVGDSYLGIKIGMALIASLIAIPAFFLTRLVLDKTEMENNIICLLSAFLITVNVYCYRLIEDFMKNHAGIFFLLCFIYFAILWFEDLNKWKSYGILTGIFFSCTFLTHIFPGLIAVVILGGIFLFNLISKSLKTRTVPKKEIILLMALGAISLIVIGLLMTLYPFTIETVWNRLKSYLNSIQMTAKYQIVIANFWVYFTIPYILGLIVVTYYLYKGLKNRVAPSHKPVITRKTFLSWVYGMLAVLLFVMFIIPTSYGDRMLFMCFIPISLISPLFLIPVLKILRDNFPSKKLVRLGIIVGISSLFMGVSLFHVVNFWKTMGPYITIEEYHELMNIKQNHINTGKIKTSGLMGVDGDYHFGYWIEYVFDIEVTTSTISGIAASYNGTELYGIYRKKHPPSPFMSPMKYPWNPLFPLICPRHSHTRSIIGDLSVAHPGPPPSYGMTLHNGTFFEVRLLYYENGTKVT